MAQSPTPALLVVTELGCISFQSRCDKQCLSHNLRALCCRVNAQQHTRQPHMTHLSCSIYNIHSLMR